MEQAQMIEQAQRQVAQVADSPEFKATAQALKQAMPSAEVTSFVRQMALQQRAAMDEARGIPEHLSPWRRHMAALHEADVAAMRKPFEPLQLEGGQMVYIRRLSGPQVERASLNASKGGNGVLDIRNSADDLRALMLVALGYCVFAEPNADGKYFNGLAESGECVDSLNPEVQAMSRTLFNACLAHNPLLMPRSVVGEPVPEPITPAALEAAEADLAELLRGVPSHPAESAQPAEPQA
jgi:hypothetical protein